MVPTTSQSQLKRAEMTSSVGAGVLGGGFALLLPTLARSYAIPILVVGLVMHAWGMWDKHRLETLSAAPRLWWAESFYWGCWILLVLVLSVLLVAR
jgi:hypothetical protein